MLPYVYDAQAADTNIVTAIDEMAQGAHRRDCADQFGPGPPPDRGRAGAWLRGAVARGPDAHADRFRRAGGFRRTQIARPAHRHHAGQRRLLHEAADIGDGGGVGEERRRGCGEGAIITVIRERSGEAIQTHRRWLWIASSLRSSQ